MGEHAQVVLEVEVTVTVDGFPGSVLVCSRSRSLYIHFHFPPSNRNAAALQSRLGAVN